MTWYKERMTMIEIMRNVIANVLTALYQPFGFAVIITIIFMFLYMYVQEYGWKTAVHHWLRSFKTNTIFRRVFLLVFYTAMILFRTLLNRYMWMNPVSNVIGTWGLYNEKGELTTEVIENLILFIPFTILLLWALQEKIIDKSVKLMSISWKSVVVVFLFSLVIEFLQLFLRIGTFQLSDLFYNTLGGFVGGFLYWCGYKFVHRNKKDET